MSSLGFNEKIPNIENMHDTCGVQYLHGIPGVLGGLASVVMAAVLKDDALHTVFGAMAKKKDGGDERDNS